jgi:hypothetical protein
MDSTQQTGVEKPKRVLTEAQRLAFMAGREKRMANILKKKAEKEEAKEIEMDVDSKPATASTPDPPIPKLKLRINRKTVDHPKPVQEEEQDTVKSEPEISDKVEVKQTTNFELYPDIIADRVIARLQAMRDDRPPTPPPPKKKYTKKARITEPSVPGTVSSLQEKNLTEITPPRQSPPRVSYNWC